MDTAKDVKLFIFRETIKQLKKELPNSCTFLAPHLDSTGEMCIKTIVNKEDHYFSLPDNLEFTKADIDRLKNLILEKCQNKK